MTASESVLSQQRRSSLSTMNSRRVSLSVLSLLGIVLQGCSYPAETDGEPIGCNEIGGLGNLCVDQSSPLDIDLLSTELEVGEDASLSVLVHDSLEGYRIMSSNPSVVEVLNFEQRDTFVELRALSVGTARISGVPLNDSEVFDSLDILVQ